MLTKLGIRMTPLPICEPRRTIEPGTARKPASRKRFSPQPSNLDGTLSHQLVPPGPGITALSLSRKLSSTAFFSH